MRRKLYGWFDFQFEAAMKDSLAADLKLVYSVKESIGLSLYLYLSRYFCISLQFFAGIQFKVEKGRDSPASSCLSRVNRLRGQLCSKLCSAPSCQTQNAHNISPYHFLLLKFSCCILVPAPEILCLHKCRMRWMWHSKWDVLVCIVQVKLSAAIVPCLVAGGKRNINASLRER